MYDMSTVTDQAKSTGAENSVGVQKNISTQERKSGKLFQIRLL